MTRLAGLLAIALLGCATGARAERAREPRLRGIRLELSAGWIDLGTSGLRGMTEGIRLGIPMSHRVALRVGASRLARPVSSDRVHAATLSTLELGAEVNLVVRPRIEIGVIGSVLHVNGKASDAEEWEREGGTSLGTRVAFAARLPLSPHLSVAPEIGIRRYERTMPGDPPPDVTPPFQRTVTDHEISVALGWRF